MKTKSNKRYDGRLQRGMVMIHAYNEELYKELQKLINLPDPGSVRKLVITMEVDNLVQVELDMYAEKGTGEVLTKSFKLIEENAIEITNCGSDEREFLLESGEIVTTPFEEIQEKAALREKEVVLVGENNGFKEFRLKRDDE